MPRVFLQSGILILVASFLVAIPLAAEQLAFSDQDITLAVERELVLDDGVAMHLIDVETKQGIVILSGQVDHLLAKERAARRVTRVQGVRAVVNNLQVKPVARTDQQLLYEVQQALLLDPATDVYALQVQVNEGTVTLQGMVDSWQEKHLSEEVTKSVTGVKQVKNDISIDYKTQRPDSELQEEITRRLAADVWVDAGLLRVQVQDGHVTLSGIVGSAAEKTQAALDAFVMGVQAVDDHGIQVDWGQRDAMRRITHATPKTDAEIAQTAAAALQYDPRLKDMPVKVSIALGVATLTGTVDNLAAKKAAEQDTRNTLGVWQVWNHLCVRPPQLREATELSKDVRAALIRDPYLERYGIEVTAFNGQVFLAGTVQSLYDKERADDVAARVPGVVQVVNSLGVLTTRPLKNDWQIQYDIQQKLQQSALIDSNDISVSVEGGVATLSGTVGNWAEHNAVISNVYEGGACDVHDALKVRQNGG